MYSMVHCAELIRQASQKRMQAMQAEQDLHKGVNGECSQLQQRVLTHSHTRTHTHTCTHVHVHTDIPTLLKQLGLEHYQERFEEEELDFDTFLTMTESDLKEIGVNTLGARRKIQIAISGTNVHNKYICTCTMIYMYHP